MLVVEVDLLTGRYTAARLDDRSRPEWPPHPARLYFALVAAWGAEDVRSTAEQEALEWLAEQDPPVIACTECAERTPVVHYVPVNDGGVVREHSRLYAALNEGGSGARSSATQRSEELSAARHLETDSTVKAGLALLPERRVRQPRTFPTAVPHDARLWFAWPAAEPGDVRSARLDALLARVHRLGHSSSLVACRVTDAARIAPTWVPDADGREVLRVPARGLLDRLEAEHARYRPGEPRVLPAALVAYRRAGRAAEVSEVASPKLGDDWVVLARQAGPRLPAARALDLARTMRAALLARVGDPVPELLSGIAPGRGGAAPQPSTRPHLAIAPLPFVGHRHADGGLLGVALILPREAHLDERRAVLRAVGAWREAGAEIDLGGAGTLRFRVAEALDARSTLRSDTWCRPSRRWSTATPVVLDRTPRHLRTGTSAERAASWDEAEETVARACEYAGLPRPVEVWLSSDGPFTGIPPVSRLPRYTTGEARLRRISLHARLTFAEPVRGPVLIGAGRYLGQGLLRPVGDDRG